jgi:catechol 2,3-dioxygenase-like lactoylglutathione lyase family enzyme
MDKGRPSAGDRSARASLLPKRHRCIAPAGRAMSFARRDCQRLVAQRIEYEAVETYSNGVRHVNVPDPDGNEIALAEPPDAASASAR